MLIGSFSKLDRHTTHCAGILLGVAAIRAQGLLQWDSERMRFPNRSDADALVGPGYEYRDGWGV